jgi:hypothetical protein
MTESRKREILVLCVSLLLHMILTSQNININKKLKNFKTKIKNS